MENIDTNKEFKDKTDFQGQDATMLQVSLLKEILDQLTLLNSK
jgi:hypothetical protein